MTGAYSSLAQAHREGAESWGSLGYGTLTAPSCPQLWDAALWQSGCAMQWVCFQTATTVSGLEFFPFPGHSLGWTQ